MAILINKQVNSSDTACDHYFYYFVFISQLNKDMVQLSKRRLRDFL